jgi:hypothetical protein
VGGNLTVVGAASMASATIANAVEIGGGVEANQVLVDNFSASSSAVFRGGSTNLLTYSEEFDNAAWTKVAASVTANTVVAPDGTLTADKLIADSTNAQHRADIGISGTGGTTYTFSVFAKAGEYSFLSLRTGNNTFASYDLLTGATSVAGSAVTAQMVSVGNGWWRCSASEVLTTTGTMTSRINVTNISSINTAQAAFTGDSTSGIFIWGAQLEAASTAGAYLKTVATAVSTAYAAPLESPNGIAFPLLATMTPARNADMTFEIASNTSLVVKVRGSDGTVRSTTLTLA